MLSLVLSTRTLFCFLSQTSGEYFQQQSGRNCHVSAYHVILSSTVLGFQIAHLSSRERGTSGEYCLKLFTSPPAMVRPSISNRVQQFNSPSHLSACESRTLSIHIHLAAPLCFVRFCWSWVTLGLHSLTPTQNGPQSGCSDRLPPIKPEVSLWPYPANPWSPDGDKRVLTCVPSEYWGSGSGCSLTSLLV